MNPDWTCVWSATQANQELVGLKFERPGWYITKTDSILVLPLDRPPDQLFVKQYTLTERFRFHVWSNIEIKGLLEQIVNAKVYER